MAKLFVSYSRKDSVAARKLVDAFKNMDLEVWVDWEDIPLAADWLNQIFTGIEEADAFIFLISPDSVASEVCRVEINKAEENNKRIIPIVLRDLADAKLAPENIRKLNWTYIRETDNFEEGLEKVKTALELDLDWLEEHRRLQVRALEWHRKKDTSLLLRGRDLQNARRMLQTYTSKDPIPTDLQRKYIEFSYRSESTRRVVLMVTAVTLLILTVLTLYAVNQRNIAVGAKQEADYQRSTAQVAATEAIKQKGIADENAATARAAEALARSNEERAVSNEKEAQAQRSAARAQIYQSRPGELYTSTLLAIDSWQKQPSLEAEEMLRNNISLLPVPVAQMSQEGSMTVMQMNPDGLSFLTASRDGTTCVRQIDSGEELFPCIKGPASVGDAIYARNGRTIVIGYESGLVRVLDAATGKPEKEITKESAPVRDLDVNKTGNDLSIAYANGMIWFQNIDRERDTRNALQIGGKNLTAAEMSEDGRWYAAGSDAGVVTVWNLNDTGNPSDYSHNRRGSVFVITFSPGNRYVISGGEDGFAIGYEIQTDKEAFDFSHAGSVNDIAFFKDAIRFATASGDARVRVWNIVSGQEELAMSQSGPVTNVEISPDEKWISATGRDTTARVWSAYTGVEMYQIPLRSPGTTLGFASNNELLLTGNEKGNLGIWDISQLVAPTLYIPFSEQVYFSRFSASGNKLAVADLHRVWSLNPQALSSPQARPPSSPVLDFRDADVTELAASPVEEMIGVSTSVNESLIFNFNFRLPVQPAGTVTAIAFTADGSRFITGTADGLVETWDITSGDLLSTQETGISVLSLAAGPGGLALGTTDKIILMDINNGQEIMDLPSPGENRYMAFNADGSLLASADPSGQIKIWKQAGQGYSLEYTLARQQPYSMAFDPQSNTLAVGAAENVYLIDALRGREIDRIHHRGNVNDVSFSPDGKTLATAALNVVQLWDTAALGASSYTDPEQAACEHLFTNFSQSEWMVFFGDDPYVSLCKELPEPE